MKDFGDKNSKHTICSVCSSRNHETIEHQRLNDVAPELLEALLDLIGRKYHEALDPALILEEVTAGQSVFQQIAMERMEAKRLKESLINPHSCRRCRFVTSFLDGYCLQCVRAILKLYGSAVGEA
jgi:hypothetical protein